MGQSMRIHFSYIYFTDICIFSENGYLKRQWRDLDGGAEGAVAPGAAGEGQKMNTKTSMVNLAESGKSSHDGIADDLECPLSAPNHPIFCILHRHSQLRNG